jgi:DNA-binding PucR family transcriptional regulator/putative methionine-R-sulfoxide reductase with GAF domain
MLVVRRSEEQVALTRSALDAARTVLRAAYCAVAWRDGEVIATHGISEARAAALAPEWLAAGSHASLTHRVEPVVGPDGEVLGVLVADLRGGVLPGDARALMPVFAAHLALLAEKVEAQARRTASYEALVQIGMQIQAAEADVDAALHLIVERARELLGTDLAWMGLVESDRLVMRVAVGARTEPFMRMRLRLGDGVGGVVVASKTPAVVPDYAREHPPTPARVSRAILGEGIGSMVCCPMLSGDHVVGALYVGSRRPREFGAIDVALTSALAAQGAVAIENGRLYEALAEQNRVLEGSFAVHRTLTDAALAGRGRDHICRELARLIGADVTLDDGASGISVPLEDLGHLHVALEELTPLQEKALEHGATVLALELTKERAQQQVEWQLQGDLLSELLDATTPSLIARARRHGVDLSRPHRIVAVRGADDVQQVRRATGRTLVHRDASLVCARGEDVVLATRDAEAVIRALPDAALGVSDATTDLALGYKQAAACARLAATRGGGVIRTDELGPLRFLLDAPDIDQVRAVVAEQLGPLVAHEGRADLLATLRAFVASDGNVAETAAACFVHKNTLRYRLRRLSEVLGRDPAEPDAKFHLRMAIDLVDLFAGMGIDVLPRRSR